MHFTTVSLAGENPHWVEKYDEKTGLDPDIVEAMWGRRNGAQGAYRDFEKKIDWFVENMKHIGNTFKALLVKILRSAI